MSNDTFEPAIIQDDLYLVNQIIQRSRELTTEQNNMIDRLIARTFPRDYNIELSITRAIITSNILFNNTHNKINFILTYLKPKEKEQLLKYTNRNITIPRNKEKKDKTISESNLQMCLKANISTTSQQIQILKQKGYKCGYNTIYSPVLECSRENIEEIEDIIKQSNTNTRANEQWRIYFKLANIAEKEKELEILEDIIVACEPEIIRYMHGVAYQGINPINLLKNVKSIENKIPQTIETLKKRFVLKSIAKAGYWEGIQFDDNAIKFGIQETRYSNEREIMEILKDNYITFNIPNGNNSEKSIQEQIHIINAIAKRVKNISPEQIKAIEELKQNRCEFGEIDIKRAKAVAELLFETESEKADFLKEYLFEDEKNILTMKKGETR